MFKVEAGEMVGPCQDDKSQRKPRFLTASAEGRSTHTATVTLPFSLRSPNREQTDGPFPRGKDGRAESGTRSQGDGTWEPWRSVDETAWDPAVQAQEETSPLASLDVLHTSRIYGAGLVAGREMGVLAERAPSDGLSVILLGLPGLMCLLVCALRALGQEGIETVVELGLELGITQ